MIHGFRFAAALVLVALAPLAACDGPAGPDRVAAITIDPDPVFVRINTTAQLQASARNSGDEELPGVAFTWTSSDTTVATISAGGVVTAKKYGQTTVAARSGGASGGAVLTVTGSPGLTVVSGDGVQDTISTTLTAPLVVEVRDSLGLPLAGRRVEFRALEPTATAAWLRVAPPGSESFIATAAGVTDSHGRALVLVQMGRTAGQASVEARYLPTGATDTAHYTIRPGAPVRLRLAPRDTAVFAGRQVALRATVFDRSGNAATATPTFALNGGPMAVAAETGVVSTSAYGTANIVGRQGGMADTVRVAAVPEGALAASLDGDIVVLNLDGTSRRVLTRGAGPSWSPSGDRVAYQAPSLGNSLMMQALAGGPPTVLLDGLYGGGINWPLYGRDGQWIYFFPSSFTINRIRPDGTGREIVNTHGENAAHASPSPDGTRIVYFNENGSYFPQIRVLDLRTGAQTPPLTDGHTPTWSPTGELIAFNEMRSDLPNNRIPGGIMVMRPDGTGIRRIAPSEARYSYSPRWSPDGRWIVAIALSGVHLIEVATGLVIALPYLESAATVDWRPGGPLP